MSMKIQRCDIEQRITDLLSQMTLEEKTCQTATLYGYNRVLKDELPTPSVEEPDLERRNRQHRRAFEWMGSRI